MAFIILSSCGGRGEATRPFRSYGLASRPLLSRCTLLCYHEIDIYEKYTFCSTSIR
mgnify:CR=1 FL=1